ncbi:MAG: EthD family reductase [Candidatus Bathyarchaeia archaeon]
MFKLIILLKKKIGLTDEQFTTHWLDTHAHLAKKMPGLRRYVVNVVMPPPNREPDYNGVVELWFDNVDDMKKAFTSPEGQATQKDTEKFTASRTTMYIDERSIM